MVVLVMMVEVFEILIMTTTTMTIIMMRIVTKYLHVCICLDLYDKEPQTKQHIRET